MAASLERDRKTTATFRWPSLSSLFSQQEGRTPYNDRLPISAPTRSANRPGIPPHPRRKEMARGNHVLVCFAHRRLYYPSDHAWKPFPDGLQDWAEEEMSRHWLFTAAPCNECLRILPQEKERVQARPRILRPPSTQLPRGKAYKVSRARRGKRPTSV